MIGSVVVVETHRAGGGLEGLPRYNFCSAETTRFAPLIRRRLGTASHALRTMGARMGQPQMRP